MWGSFPQKKWSIWFDTAKFWILLVYIWEGKNSTKQKAPPLPQKQVSKQNKQKLPWTFSSCFLEENPVLRDLGHSETQEGLFEQQDKTDKIKSSKLSSIRGGGHFLDIGF